MSGYLELADGALMVVKNDLVLGRVAACDIVIDDTKASRRHARLVVESGVVEIEDLGSSNGTLLNGKPVDRRMLRDGDEVRIGKTAIVYREGALPLSRGKSSSASAGSRAVSFDDDDDLLGGEDLGGTDLGGNDLGGDDLGGEGLSGEDLLGGDDLAADVRESAPASTAPKPEPPSPPPPPAAPSNVVEFEDEVVEVEKAPPPRPAKPANKASSPFDEDDLIAVRKPARSSEAASPAGATASGKDDEVVASSQRVLQFSKQAGGKNVLGDDLGQMSGGMRALIVLGVVVVGGGIAWAIMQAMQ